MELRLVPLAEPHQDLLPIECGLILNVAADATLVGILSQAQQKSPRAFQLREGQETPQGTWSPQLVRASAWEPLEPAFSYDPVPVYVEEDGRARWHVAAGDATLGGLQRTVEAGVLDARTDTLGYWLEPWGRGNGGYVQLLDHWQVFVAFVTAWVLQPVVSSLIDRLIGVVQKRWQQWRDRGGSPRDWVDLILSRNRWAPVELAGLLDVGEDEAVGCLEGFGYRPADAVTYELVVGAEGADESLVLRLTTYRHVAWFRAFPPEEAEKLAAANPHLPLRSDLSAHRRSGEGR